ncbi:MAG: Uma2 family endonuclease [Lacipirellulaceae bacterium]
MPTTQPDVPTSLGSFVPPADGFEGGWVADPMLLAELRDRRALTGADRYDETWEGVYVMAPSADDDHQEMVYGFADPFRAMIDALGLGRSRPGMNVSDRVVKWTDNFRCPDVAVFLNGTKATNHGAFWHGGPDFAVEIVSPRDRTREKLDFYAAVGTRELLIVDRDPWRLELLRLDGSRLVLIGVSTVKDGGEVASAVLPFTFRLVAGEHRPWITVRHESGQAWNV